MVRSPLPSSLGLRNFIGSLLVKILLVATASAGYGQYRVMHGTVQDASTQEILAGATLWVDSLQRGTSTNDEGKYNLVLSPGYHQVAVSYVGYEPHLISLTLSRDTLITIGLTEVIQELDELAVFSEALNRNITSAELGVSRLDQEQLKQMPAFLGEVDVIKSVQMLPGVTTVGEGTTGLNVRGGNADQNLTLIDEAPIFNTSHLMGFMSVFNPDVVDNITFYRAGIPAQYGGRASSVLDVKLKDPDATRWQGRGGVGLAANRLMVEGPLVRKKMGVMLAGRLFPAYVLRLSTRDQVRRTRASFYDLTGKWEYRPTNRSRISLSGYWSNDAFKLPGDSLSAVEVNATSSQFRWETRNATLAWTHKLSDKVYTQLTGVWSEYRSSITSPDSLTAFSLRSRLGYRNAKLETTILPSHRHQLLAGASAIHYRISPGNLQPDHPASNINPLTLPEQASYEMAFYISDQFEINRHLNLHYGLRYAWYFNTAPGQVFRYQPDAPRRENTIIDTLSYAPGNVIQSYRGLEPRLSLKISLSPKSSVKIGYDRMQQFIQLVSNTTAALPTDRWLASDTYVRPQITDQLSLGYFRNFRDNRWQTSLEGYYKRMESIADYKDGVNLLLNPILEAAILQGSGEAYGAELYVRRTQGALTGWLSYTFAQVYWQVNGPSREEQINRGAYYPPNFNKPHTLNLVTNYRISERVQLASNFTYSSGRAITYPDDKYYVQNLYIPNYTNRNQNTIPDYHRLDLSLTVDSKSDPERRFTGSWVLSVYNVYSRNNAYSIFFKTKNNNVAKYLNKANAYKLSIFGAMFPSITYNFQF